ncbi:cytochrome P450 [Mycolicibacterium cosmeticum]|uniref:cytochrome P450 n=1 Tax=Mycolicibacterium cosmeticum TaxID=258533 RepID=UPI003204CA3E
MTTDLGLPTLDYSYFSHAEDAHRAIADARLRAPIASGPMGPELLTYELVRTVLRDPRFAAAQRPIAELQGCTDGPLWRRISTLILSTDGERHHRLRRLVAKAFTPRATARLDGLIVGLITDLVTRHLSVGRCDVVSDIARRLPIPVICALLGTPREDWERFSDWIDDIGKMLEFNLAEDGPTILAAWEELDRYLSELIALRRRSLADDLLSDLISSDDDGDQLSHDELLSLATIVLGAGTDTTRNQLAAAVDVFCDHPDQWALLRVHPTLAGRAVDEALRYRPIGFCLPRVATEDVELAGIPIPAGTIVLANTAAANRDPAAFPHADRFDITRENSSPILAFGSGTHYCLGSHLARVELTRALEVMSQCMPGLKRAGPAPWRPLKGVTGPATLPVAFD